MYEIIAEYVPENGTLAGTVKVTFENPTDNALDVLKFQLYPNAYRKGASYIPVAVTDRPRAYYKGESYGEMVISSVNGGKNWEVMGEDENILYVFLERALFPNEKVVLDIGFITKLATVEHRLGVGKQTVNLGNFFPILCGIKRGGFYETLYYDLGNPFYLDYANYKITLTVPKEYQVLSTGQEIEERTLESKKAHTMYASNVRDFAIVLSKNYRFKEEKIGDQTVTYAYYQDNVPDKTFAMIKEMFVYYEKTFGAYPYSQYTVAETGLCLSGAEYPCLTMMSDALNEEEKTETLAHEIAHQWWYAVVGSNAIEEAWQDESLARYASVLFFETHEKYGRKREDTVMGLLKEYRSYYDVYGSVLGRTDTKMKRHLSQYVNDFEYKCLSYHKGVVMWDTLRKSVGDAKFFTALKKYYRDNRYRIATPEDVIAAFERVGLDVRGYFESFWEGKNVL